MGDEKHDINWLLVGGVVGGGALLLLIAAAVALPWLAACALPRVLLALLWCASAAALAGWALWRILRPAAHSPLPARIAGWSCLALLAIVWFAVIVLVAHLWRTSTPAAGGSLQLAGLDGEARAFRTADGVLTVEASSERDLWFAQGAAAARERLFQMDFQRRLAHGRLSEIVGNATLAIDQRFRTYGFTHAARAARRGASAASLATVERYVAGINAYLDSAPPLPLEYTLLGSPPEIERFTVVDVLAWGKVMSFQLSNNFDYELQRYEAEADDGGDLSAARYDTLKPDYDLERYPTVIRSNDVDDDDDDGDPIAKYAERLQRDAAANRTNDAAADDDDEPASDGMSPEPAPAPADERKRALETLGRLRTAPHRVRNSELQRLIKLYAGLDQEKDASNNWVVAGKHMANGHAFAANDPHLGHSIPSIWLLVRLRADGREWSGAAFALAPGIVIGTNGKISFGITNVGTDVQDGFILELDGDGYSWNGEREQFTEREEEIAILGADNVTMVVRETRVGPVMSDVIDIVGLPATEVVALRWVALDEDDRTIDALLLMNQASDWDEFNEAMALFKTPASSMAYSDAEGNIGFVANGVIPIRAEGHDGKRFYKASGDADMWLGYAPYELNPKLFNPDRGFIVTANEPIMPPTQKRSGGMILNYADWASGHRAKRIEERIEALIKEKSGKITVDDMAQLQLDVRSTTYDELKPMLEKLRELEGDDGELAAPLDSLLEWDGDLAPDSAPAGLYAEWMARLFLVAESETEGEWRPGIDYVVATFRDVDDDENDDRACTAALESAVSDAADSDAPPCVAFARVALQQAVDSGVPALGQRQAATFNHQIIGASFVGCVFRRSYPIGGSIWTVSPAANGPLELYEGSTLPSSKGASYRHLIVVSDLSESRFMGTAGRSENTFDSSYNAFVEPWALGNYAPMRHADASVSSTLTFLPTDD